MIKMIIMLIYLISIFYISEISILVALIFINMLIMLLYKVKIIEFMSEIIFLLPFTLFTFIINYFIADLEYASFIVIRLFLAYMISYTFLKITTIKEIVLTIEKMLKPLRIFNMDYKNIALIIYIAISIIPNIINELQQKIYSIKAKSININFRNILLIIKSILISIIIKVNEFENALISKGYSN